MEEVFLIRFSELFLKGKNKGIFEKLLLDNIKASLKNIDCETKKINGRYLVSNYKIDDKSEIIAKLKNVFGIFSFSPAIVLNNDKEQILDYAKQIKLNSKTFRVTVNRADKNFPVNSTLFSADVGEVILNSNENIKVDLFNPDVNVNIDIRENGHTYLFYETISGLGGMPVGSSSDGLLLLSGGIDSPVAGFMMAKRGMKINALHFASFPYTSQMAKEKVITLAKILKNYVGNFKLYIVSFTEIQEQINKKCASEMMITLMRRIMMRIAEKISNDNNYKAIITGESLGQVASQTIESITVTNEVVNRVPILRPLIAFDKEDITQISKKIGTFNTSILPYEDCCTVFLPKYPVIKPKEEKVLKNEKNLDIELLIKNALNSIEIIEI